MNRPKIQAFSLSPVMEKLQTTKSNLEIRSQNPNPPAHNWRVTACCIFLFCAASTVTSFAQTFTTIATFDGSDGTVPLALILGTDGNLWGPTQGAGGTDCGGVYNSTLSGVISTVVTFNCASDSDAFDLLLGNDGNYYGIAGKGGPSNDVAFYKLSPSGTLTNLHYFHGVSDGRTPSEITQAPGGIFYGVTINGGTHGGPSGFGTLFKMSGGTVTTFIDFAGPNGTEPYGAPTVGSDGNIYGTTLGGGAYHQGVIYKITPSGTLTVLHSFGATSADGNTVYDRLTQASNGSFYGMASAGGLSGDGTIFRISPTGVYSNIHTFSGPDGSFAVGGLVQASDGFLYGTTFFGGANDNGTIYKISPSGAFTSVYSLTSADGSFPVDLNQSTNGTFYGLANTTIFSFSVGLGPFVKALPVSGAVGRSIIILGQGFTGATAVDFNGISATFAVVSDSEITTTVPTGATTGDITVTTPGGTLSTITTFMVP